MEDTQRHPDELVLYPSNLSADYDDNTYYDIHSTYIGDRSVSELISMLRKVQRAQWNLSEEVRRLRDNDQSNLVSSLTQQLATARLHHQEDIDRIGEVLTDKAEQHDWCSEYDDTVDDLNCHLHRQLPERSRDWSITYSLSTSVTITANGRDGEAAEDSVDMSEIREALIESLRYGGGSLEIEDTEIEMA